MFLKSRSGRLTTSGCGAIQPDWAQAPYQGKPVIDDAGLVPAGVPVIRLYVAETLARWFRC